jgi:alkyl sulfatase BDS1-like metallo-beta-lactamase superfamily hydrolase
MGEILELAERYWAGEIDPREHLRVTGKTEVLAPHVWFLHAWANVTAIETEPGLVLIDTGNFATREKTFAAVRAFDERPVHTAIYTHGHVDHACGLPPFLKEAEQLGWPRPRIIGHRNVGARFDRYRATAGYNAIVNARQFSIRPTWPTEYDYPDEVYDVTTRVEVGSTVLELHHARGETDDHTWVWWPDRRILFTGDQFFWTAPNAGNPQKAQRYAADWAASLREMLACEAELLVPGHGVPIAGADRIRQALGDTAEWLEVLVDETIARMNAGMPLETIVREVQPPAHLVERPYLRVVYDEPEYVVRNVWRLNGGWWDGVPSHLKPAPQADLGREIAGLAGGVKALVRRGRALLEAGEPRLAAHLVDWAVAAEPDNAEAHATRAELYETLARVSPALMTRGIYAAAAKESAGLAHAPARPDRQ